jgi:hypothetical protein
MFESKRSRGILVGYYVVLTVLVLAASQNGAQPSHGARRLAGGEREATGIFNMDVVPLIVALYVGPILVASGVRWIRKGQ